MNENRLQALAVEIRIAQGMAYKQHARMLDEIKDLSQSYKLLGRLHDEMIGIIEEEIKPCDALTHKVEEV